MPRTVFDQKRKYDKLVGVLRGNAITSNKTYADIGKMVGRSEQTIVARFKSPESFTLDELTRIGRGLNIPIEEFRQCIMY